MRGYGSVTIPERSVSVRSRPGVRDRRPPSLSRMERLRVLALALVAGLASVLGLVATPAAQACACGGFVAPDGEDIAASAEYAVLTWDGETERVLLSMDALAEGSDAALLIPTPAPAEAALADVSVFAELEELTAPEVVVDYQWWPDLGLGAGSGDGAPGASGGAVSVLDVKQLGDIEVTVLAASDADELADWLDEHGYVMQDDLADALMPYVTEGWYYLAIRLTTEAENLSGALQPLDLTFASPQLIYPMRLSAAATSSQFVRTFVFSDHRVQRTDETAANGDTSLWFAGEVAPTAVTSEALVSIISEQPYLTVLDQYFTDPSEQIVSDFTFAQAPADTTHREVEYETRMREILGIPAGPALTFIAMVVVLVAILTASGVRRRRRRRRIAG